MIGTPHLERLKAAVRAAFPDAIFGQFNCKRRNGWNWSQHAGSEPAFSYRGNAVDIVHKDHGYGDTSPAHQAWLDQVHALLVVNFVALELNELIWRKRRHFDHIHTSPWPKMHDAGLYVPPCKGGNLIVVNKDGSRGSTFGDVTPPPPPPTLEVNMLSEGSKGRAVAFYQEALMEWDDRALPKFGADGDYGDETVEWVNHFIFFQNLTQTGIIDGVVADLLGPFHPTRNPDAHVHPPTLLPHDHDDTYAKTSHPHTVNEQTTVN